MSYSSRCAQAFIYLALILLTVSSNVCSQNLTYRDVPIIQVFNQIEEETAYSFLYRESLVSGVKLNLHTTRQSLADDLSKALTPYNLSLKVDSIGMQFLILPRQVQNTAPEEILISGQVVDAKTGERLPFSTISWRVNGTLNGTAASESGRFRVKVQPVDSLLNLEASYVGYQSTSVSVNLTSVSRISDLTFRLQPQSLVGSEIIIIGNNYYTPQDSSLTGLIKTDRYSPLGEGNAVRALQVLPSVNPTTAMNDGLNIRGSTPDGFHLELDGVTIFNQSHLFGMLDSFNEDAVLNSGFFYNVAPAHIHAPIGGKLSLTTRTGSLQNKQARASFSNTSFRMMADGPLQFGKSSWMISGRTSYMNQLNWFNNDKLIRWGLDIDRPKTNSGSNQDINTELVNPLDSDVHYFDLHGKVYFEGKDGSRNMASIYFGGDQTKHLANRLARNNSFEDRFRTIEVETENKWNNFAFSAQNQRAISSSIYSNTTIALSAYETKFSKDDFLYTNTSRLGESVQTTVFTYPLTNRSTMNRGKINQTFDVSAGPMNFKTGLSGIYHRGEYQENSFDRSQFYTRVSAIQGDLFFQTDFTPFQFLNLHTGLRTHYYSAGNFFKFSPRIKADLFEDKLISLSFGYSQNHQFINRIGFSNAVTADVWILSSPEQPPSSVNQITAGLYLKPIQRLFLQIEGYWKKYENLRSHELNARSLTNTFNDSPWFFQNKGVGKGIEFLARFRAQRFSITQTYTLSSIKLKNEFLNEGQEFYAPWDRRHIANSNFSLQIVPNIQLFASYIMASGSISGTLDLATGENQRLGTYHRLDLSALYTKQWNSGSFSVKASVFNALDEQNPWYREYQPVIVTRNTIPAIRSEVVTVYDLGIQPSFEIKIDF